MRKSLANRVPSASIILLLAFAVNCAPKIDPKNVELIGAYKYALGDCTAAYENYLAIQYKTLFENELRKTGYGGSPAESLRPKAGACYQTHLNEIVLRTTEFCSKPEYYAIVDVFHQGFGLQTFPDGSSGPHRDPKVTHIDTKKFDPVEGVACNKQGVKITLKSGLNAIHITIAKKPIQASSLLRQPIEQELFEDDSANHVAFVTVASAEVLKKIGGGYDARAEANSRYLKEEAEKEAAALLAVNINDSPYLVFCRTNQHFCGSNLTSSQVANNENYYSGKKFRNWYLKVADDGAGCIQTSEPNTGYNWGQICGQDAVKFKEKYPNYRQGTGFTIKSGTFKRFSFGGPLMENLEF